MFFLVVLLSLTSDIFSVDFGSLRLPRVPQNTLARLLFRLRQGFNGKKKS